MFQTPHRDRKSTRLNSSHVEISYAVFCLKKKQSAEEQHIRDMWGPEATPSPLVETSDRPPFKRGQSDRFREGLRRSGAWDMFFLKTRANTGFPPFPAPPPLPN